MAKYYDEPRRDTSTSTLTDETPKYQKAAQRKKVAKGCPALDGDAHIYGADKIITKDRENDTVRSRLSNIRCAFCGHTRRRYPNAGEFEVVHTTVYDIRKRVPGSFDKFYGKIYEYDYDANELGRRI